MGRERPKRRSTNIAGELPKARILNSLKRGGLMSSLLNTPDTVRQVKVLDSKFKESDELTVLDLPLVDPRSIENDWESLLLAQFPRPDEYTDKMYLTRIKEAVEVSDRFLRKTIDIPQALVAGPTSFDKTRKNYVDIIRRAKSVHDLQIVFDDLLLYLQSNKKTDFEKMRHVALCGFVKTAIGAYILADGKMEKKEKAFDFFVSALSGKEGFDRFWFSKSQGTTSCTNMETANYGIELDYCARLKSIDSALLKLFIDKKARLEQALKDAIGVRVEMPASSIKEFIEELAIYLEDHRSDLKISGKACLEMTGGLVYTSDMDLHTEFIKVLRNDKNIKSSGKYKDIKLRFTIDYEGLPVNIEFQILHRGHRNESGMSNHNVYDLKKYIPFMQRVYYFVPNAWMRGEIQKISRGTKLSDDNILNSLIESGAIKKRGKNYINPEMYTEWAKISS